MKQTIRFNTFETNSSSTHSLTIMTQDEFEKFKAGDLMFSRWTAKLVPASEATKENPEDDDNDDNEYWDYENFGGEYMETDSQKFTTPSGDKMVAICYYGMDC